MCRLSRDFGPVHRCRVCQFLSWPIFSSRVIFFSRASTFCSIFLSCGIAGAAACCAIVGRRNMLANKKDFILFMVVCIWVQQSFGCFGILLHQPVLFQPLAYRFVIQFEAMESTKTDTAMNKCIPAGASGLFRAQAICMYISGKCVMYSG